MMADVSRISHGAAARGRIASCMFAATMAVLLMAGGGALAAAGTDFFIDQNVVAVGRNSAGRAEIEAAVATDNL